MTTLAEKHINPEVTAAVIVERAQRNLKLAESNGMSESVIKSMRVSVAFADRVMQEAKSFGLTTYQVKHICRILDDDDELIARNISPTTH